MAWELEDTVQTVFLRAFDERARLAYDGLRPYRNYLFSIARNLVIDGLRGKRVELFEERGAPCGDQAMEKALDTDRPLACPEKLAAEREVQSHVKAFINLLTANQRQVFEVRFRQGMSVESSAKTLQKSEHRIKRDEKLIKKRFFKYMREQGYFEGYRYGRLGLEKITTMLFCGLCLSQSLGCSMGASIYSGVGR